MSYKEIHFHSQAREKILKGASALTDAVRVTLGPKSRSVLIERKWGVPIVCNDGVTVAKEIELRDPEENLGARMIRQAAEKTGDVVGDGTTTATLLAHALFSEGLKNVVAGASAVDLKRGMERGLRVAVEVIRRLARPVKSHAERAQVAAVAAHNDGSIGAMVADAFERVGKEGVVTLEEAKGTETVLEVVEGMQFDHGYLSPYFVTDPLRMECLLEEPVILFYDAKIASMKTLLPLLEQVLQTGKPLLIIAEDVEDEALATLVVSRLRGALVCVAVKAPGFGDRRKATLEDMAILTGGKVISPELGKKLEHVGPDDLGRVDRAIVTQEATTLVGGGGDRERLTARMALLRQHVSEAKSDYDKQKLEERLAKLSGGVAVIHVGAPSEAEMKSRKEAFDDAVHSTRAAMAEGIVPGCGLALLRAIEAVEREERQASDDEKVGLRILRHALEMPTRQIAENSGVDGGVIVEKMRHGSESIGFDAAKSTWVDLMEAGIVDPAKVVRVALENAVSVASLLLLTEATVTEAIEKEPTPAGHVME